MLATKAIIGGSSPTGKHKLFPSFPPSGGHDQSLGPCGWRSYTVIRPRWRTDIHHATVKPSIQLDNYFLGPDELPPASY